MPSDIWTSMLTNYPSLRNKSLRARNKVAHVKLFREVVRLVPQCAVPPTSESGERRIQKIFSAFRKEKAKPRNNFITEEQFI